MRDFNPRRALRYLPIIASSVVLSACATNPADAQSATPGRVAQARQVCAHTMNLNPANADYDMCVTSLLRTLAGMDQASLVQRDRRVCMQRGLTPDTRDFAVCVVDAETPTVN